jgi:DNA-binding transcriptional ArsR family regulator
LTYGVGALIIHVMSAVPARSAPPPPPAGPVRASDRAAGLTAGRAPDFDRLIHERLRLGIVSALAVNAALTFTELRDLLGATDGNLGVHARKLEDAGYVAVVKSFEGRVPRTEYTLADAAARRSPATSTTWKR